MAGARARAKAKQKELEEEYAEEIKGNTAELCRIKALLSGSEASNSTMAVALETLNADHERCQENRGQLSERVKELEARGLELEEQVRVLYF